VVDRFKHRYIPYIVTAKIQTANVAHLKKIVPLTGFSAYPDGSSS
jgi:hypothetical protein